MNAICMMAIAAVMMILMLPDTAAAYYSPALGRFMQRDPLGYVDGMNLYEYVQGEPLNGLDPTGTKKDWLNCMAKCIEDLDPVGSMFGSSPKWVGIGFGYIPKWFMRRDPTAPPVGSLITLLRTWGGRAAPGLFARRHWFSLGRPMGLLGNVGTKVVGPMSTGYGLWLAAAEFACLGKCAHEMTKDGPPFVVTNPLCRHQDMTEWPETRGNTMTLPNGEIVTEEDYKRIHDP